MDVRQIRRQKGKTMNMEKKLKIIENKKNFEKNDVKLGEKNKSSSTSRFTKLNTLFCPPLSPFSSVREYQKLWCDVNIREEIPDKKQSARD